MMNTKNITNRVKDIYADAYEDMLYREMVKAKHKYHNIKMELLLSQASAAERINLEITNE